MKARRIIPISSQCFFGQRQCGDILFGLVFLESLLIEVPLRRGRQDDQTGKSHSRCVAETNEPDTFALSVHPMQRQGRGARKEMAWPPESARPYPEYPIKPF